MYIFNNNWINNMELPYYVKLIKDEHYGNRIITIVQDLIRENGNPNNYEVLLGKIYEKLNLNYMNGDIARRVVYCDGFNKFIKNNKMLTDLQADLVCAISDQMIDKKSFSLI